MKPISHSPSPIPLHLAKGQPPVKFDQKMIDERKLQEAAEEFESLLVMQMLQSMQSSLENNSLFGKSNADRIYGGMGEMELAKTIARTNDFGVKDQLLEYVRKLEQHAHEFKSK